MRIGTSGIFLAVAQVGGTLTLFAMSGAQPSRVTLRQVAHAAGVSLATASLALRSDARITPDTREKVIRTARALGYRPDPAVSAFMLGLRRGQPAPARANIAVLPFAAELPPGTRPYAAAIRAGVEAHATSRGYSVIDVGLKQHGRRLGKVLYAQGVSGVILLPLAEPQDLSGALDWSGFSVVATSFTITRPRVHVVVPHHFANMQQILGALQARGYRRLGLLLSGRGFVERVNRTFLAAVALHNRQVGAAAVEPLVVEGERFIAGALPSWLAEQKPDVVITNNAPAVSRLLGEHGLRIPGNMGLLDLGADHADQFACFDQMPRLLGEEAAFRVISLMHRGEKGVPPRAFVSMLEGELVDGRSLRRRPVASV